MEDRPSVDIAESQLRIPSQDETVAATRYSPEAIDNPLPVLLMAIPYRKDDHIIYGAYDPLIKYLTFNGYNVVVSDLIGTGGSSGFLEKPMAFVGTEASDIIEWLADRKWSTGRVGMFGKSYGGRTCLNAAADQPESLEAIVPITASYSSYDDSKYQGGAINFYKQIAGWTPLMQTLAAIPPTRRDIEGQWDDIWQERLDNLSENEPWLFQLLAHDTKDSYWKEIDPKIENINVPVFAISGWRDFYPHAPLNRLPDIQAPTRILMGPWRHTVPHRGHEVAINGREQILEWFDYFLKDKDNDALDHSYLEYWTEKDGGGKSGIWRSENTWPTIDDNESTLSFALSSDGMTPKDNFTDGFIEKGYEFDQTVGMDSIDYLSPAVDTNADDARSLTFESAVLENPVEWTGTGRAVLRVTPTVKDHLVVVRIVDVSPEGEATLVSSGRVKASQRESYEDPKPLTPGEEYSFNIPLKPKSHVFEPGHRIRVAISAAYFPLLLAPRYQGSFKVSSDPADPSFIEFPGAEHEDGISFDDTLEMASPDTKRYPASSPYVTIHSTTWDVVRDHKNNTATFQTSTDKTIDLPHGATIYWEREIETSVQADDPLSSVSSSNINIKIDFGNEEVHVKASSRATHDLAAITEQVWIDGNPTYDETWRWSRGNKREKSEKDSI